MTNAETMDAVFHALSHHHRRLILDLLKADPGCCVNDVCAKFDTSRIAIMKHLRVLEDADLVVSRKEGRMRRLYLNAVPIQMIHDRWMSDYSSFWAGKMTGLKYRLEAKGEQHE